MECTEALKEEKREKLRNNNNKFDNLLIIRFQIKNFFEEKFNGFVMSQVKAVQFKVSGRFSYFLTGHKLFIAKHGG